MSTRTSKNVFIEMTLKNNPSVLKEYKDSYGVSYKQFLNK